MGRINPSDRCGPNRCAVLFLSIWLIPAAGNSRTISLTMRAAFVKPRESIPEEKLMKPKDSGRRSFLKNSAALAGLAVGLAKTAKGDAPAHEGAAAPPKDLHGYGERSRLRNFRTPRRHGSVRPCACRISSRLRLAESDSGFGRLHHSRLAALRDRSRLRAARYRSCRAPPPDSRLGGKALDLFPRRPEAISFRHARSFSRVQRQRRARGPDRAISCFSERDGAGYAWLHELQPVDGRAAFASS